MAMRIVRAFFRFGFRDDHFLHALIWSACAFVTYAVWVTLEHKNGRDGFTSAPVAAGKPQRFVPGLRPVLIAADGSVTPLDTGGDPGD